ncbi:hypothetical protein FBZ89_1111 [Nitrospirillum amazonense]|uniref:Uncharacterized protein n=1 Tax=Nitrospirillum amazonense TaxID=28077 RepID=A0A560F695_9PROT|nr:hypothetical protein [Nitrospirillum amazonense]TWB17150.1 hypothetical protein FBZ89_1111 [Nitrospirillum amazonense]
MPDQKPHGRVRRALGWRPSPQARLWLRRLLTPLAVAAALAYVLVDVCFLPLVRPFANRMGRWSPFQALGRFIDRLGPRTTLVLFLVPLVVLEPAKPLGAFLIAQGKTRLGILLIVAAEVLKLLTVERLFQRSRHKLLTIRWFARVHGWIVGWIDRLKALPAWRAVVALAKGIRAILAPVLSAAWRQAARSAALARERRRYRRGG